MALDAVTRRFQLRGAVVMRRIRNPAVHEVVAAMRSRNGIRVALTGDSPLALIRILRSGGAIMLLADQDTKHVRSIGIEFFGRPARTPVGPARLARHGRAPLLPTFVLRDPVRADRMIVRFQEPIYPDAGLKEDEDAGRMLRRFTEALEGEIRKSPHQWAWMHERWRHAPAGQDGN
jgi:KDO2-lipid IV(A) lauroyltransferase